MSIRFGLYIRPFCYSLFIAVILPWLVIESMGHKSGIGSIVGSYSCDTENVIRNCGQTNSFWTIFYCFSGRVVFLFSLWYWHKGQSVLFKQVYLTLDKQSKCFGNNSSLISTTHTKKYLIMKSKFFTVTA